VRRYQDAPEMLLAVMVASTATEGHIVTKSIMEAAAVDYRFESVTPIDRILKMV